MKMRGLFKANFLILVISSLLFIPFIGIVPLFDWDEINFAEIAREMIVTGDYLTARINYLPFWEKPPLFIWMQVISMKIFGINEFAARFPNAVCGILSLLILYNIGKKLHDHHLGIIWVITFAGSILPFFYFKSGIIDPWFNLFIFCGIYFFVLFTKAKNRFHLVLAAVSIGLAILTKGPVAFLIFILTVLIYWGLNKFKLPFSLKNILLFFVILAFAGGFWFILEIANGNLLVIKDFIVYQIRLFRTEDAGHGGFFFYHFVVLLFGAFPASVFALRSLFSKKDSELDKMDFQKWMKILFWIVLILFTIVKTKIIHYSSLCYFPLTYLASITIYSFFKQKKPFSSFYKFLIIFIGLLYIVITVSLPFLIKYKDQFMELIKDDFAKGNLTANVSWTGFESIIIVVLITGIVFFFIYSKKILTAIVSLFGSVLVFTYLFLLIFLPKIEMYSQHAAIEFYKSVKHENVYVSTIGYKSYAHLFYSEAPMHVNKNAFNRDWLLSGEIDKKAYFVSKVNRKYEIQLNHPSLILIYEKNGFVFWLRKPEYDKYKLEIPN